jgi:cytochrome P450
MDLSSVPVVPGETLLGHQRLFHEDRLRFLRAAGEAGPLSRIRFLHRWVLLANSPAAAHEILVEHARSFEKSPGIRIVLHDLAGNGLFTSEGELWRRQRRLMSPLFHATQLAEYGKTMGEVAAHSLARLRDGESIDLAREMTRITMGVVGATLFGADTYGQADDLGAALTVALKWVDDSLASTMLTLQLTALEAFEKLEPHVPSALAEIQRTIDEALRGPVLLRGSRDEELRAAIRLLDGRIQSMVDERRAHPQARVDLLTRLLLARDSEGGRGAAGAGMSDSQIRDEANTLFIAGHETTANALAWTFYLLARHPEARARVQAEADAFDPGAAAAFVPERLAYTTRVFKEALRLYPPLVLLVRRALEPVEILGHEYPTKTLAFVNPYAVHHAPDVWPDPDRFDPDRFTPEREAARHKSAWIPFGVGPRVCIGNSFALMEGPIVLATLMRGARFEIDAQRVIEADAFATLRPRGGVPAVVRKGSRAGSHGSTPSLTSRAV